MKKIKVTKRTRKKKPWYERPMILFPVIAGVLLVGGVAVSYLYRQQSAPTTVLGIGGEDSAAVTVTPTPAPTEPETALAEHVMAADTELPVVASGELLPPLRAETLAEGARVRDALRAARSLAPLDGAGEGPAFGFSEAGAVAATLTAADPPARWLRLAPSADQRNWADFEVHRGGAGELYLFAYVATDVAEQIGALGPALPLPPPVEEGQSPWWQFWKKREAAPFVLRQGTSITLYPDLSPEATCAVVLPLTRIATAEAREIVGGVARRTMVLDVTMR